MPADKVEVENVNVLGQTTWVDAISDRVTRDALLRALPDALPGLTQAEMIDATKRRLEARKRIHRSYLEHTRLVNGWDLVDTTVEHLVGPHVDPADPTLLDRRADSDSVWERRITMMATFHWTRTGVVEPALRIADLVPNERGGPRRIGSSTCGGRCDRPVEGGYHLGDGVQIFRASVLWGVVATSRQRARMRTMQERFLTGIRCLEAATTLLPTGAPGSRSTRSSCRTRRPTGSRT